MLKTPTAEPLDRLLCLDHLQTVRLLQEFASVIESIAEHIVAAQAGPLTRPQRQHLVRAGDWASRFHALLAEEVERLRQGTTTP